MAAQVKSAQVKQESGQLYVRVNGQSWQPCKMVDASPGGSIVVQVQDKPQDKPQDESGYNGWSNYETWCVNLHLSNDSSLYRYAQSFSDADSLQQAITDDVYTLIESQSAIAPIIGMMYQDLLISSLQSVNWYEVYESLHEEDEENE